MIAKVGPRYGDVASLIRYVYGAGRTDDDPGLRIVADGGPRLSWNHHGAPAAGGTSGGWRACWTCRSPCWATPGSPGPCGTA